jgi:hypothetical protein
MVMVAEHGSVVALVEFPILVMTGILAWTLEIYPG